MAIHYLTLRYLRPAVFQFGWFSEFCHLCELFHVPTSFHCKAEFSRTLTLFLWWFCMYLAHSLLLTFWSKRSWIMVSSLQTENLRSTWVFACWCPKPINVSTIYYLRRDTFRRDCYWLIIILNVLHTAKSLSRTQPW